MYRVILVDDEPWTLQGIRETFHWEKYGFEVIAAHTFATKALNDILEQKPDVVFTDIRMPVINGIDLLNEIRKKELETEVIIISGFGQFDYAQEAIRQGAFDYVLKPIDDSETDKLLERLKRKLDAKLNIENRRVIEMLVNEPEGIAPEQFGLHNRYAYYQVIASDGLEYFEIKEFLQQRRDLEFIEIPLTNRIYYIINCMEDLSEIMINYRYQNGIGISSLSDNSDQILELVSQATIAVSEFFITNTRSVSTYHELRSSILIPYIFRITKILNEGRLVDFKQMVDEIPAMFRKKNYSVEDLCFLWNRIVMHVELIAPDKIQNSALDLCEWQQLEIKFDTLETMCQTLIDGVDYCFSHSGYDPEEEDASGSTNFTSILKYLNHNYNKQIKLKDLAQLFFINKNYACFLFKKYTGMTYSEYLNKIRMEHAKEMLVTTTLTIAEITEKAGYVDYFYFCKLFKKIYGMTPTQFRNNPMEMAN